MLRKLSVSRHRDLLLVALMVQAEACQSPGLDPNSLYDLYELKGLAGGVRPPAFPVLEVND